MKIEITKSYTRDFRIKDESIPKEYASLLGAVEYFGTKKQGTVYDRTKEETAKNLETIMYDMAAFCCGIYNQKYISKDTILVVKIDLFNIVLTNETLNDLMEIYSFCDNLKLIPCPEIGGFTLLAELYMGENN